MNTATIGPALEQPPVPSPVRQATSRNGPGLLPHLDRGTGDRSSSQSHRRRAAALIRQLGGRTDAALRRELDRFFAARSGLTHADRAAISRAMSRFRNQLLHRPRSALRAAAGNAAADTNSWLDVARRLFGLNDAPHSRPADKRIPASRPSPASARSAT
jgi:hypothetical protein